MIVRVLACSLARSLVRALKRRTNSNSIRIKEEEENIKRVAKTFLVVVYENTAIDVAMVMV